MRKKTIDKLFVAMQESKGLPAVESTVTSLLNSLRDRANTNGAVVGHIIEDFALTQKVLKLVNSPMYAPFGKHISSISSALEILGADALMHIVLSTAMVSAAELENDDSLSRTLLASELARSVSTDRKEDASIAALMYDLGGLLAAKYLPDELAAITKKINAGADADRAATEVLGMTLQQIGTDAAQRWNLPPAIVSIIDGSGDQTLVDIARFSSSASSLIHDGKLDEVNQLVSALNVPGTDKSRLTTLIKRKADSMAPNTRVAAPAADVLEEVLATLTEVKKKNIEELAAAMFPEFGHSLHTARCLLFTHTPSGEFTVRYGYGKGIDELRSKLKISAEFKPTAFHAAIKNKVDVSIADVTKLKPAMLPDSYNALLPHVTKFLILPICNGHVGGLIYCDWETDKDITQDELTSVKKLRDLFLPFFPH